MKKWLLSIPIILFPYTILAMLYCIFTGFLIETVFQNNFLYCVLFIFIFGILALICEILLYFLCYKGNTTALDFAFLNMVIKLSHIPAYIVIFVLGILFLITIFTIGFSLAFIIFDAFTIFISGIVGILAVRKNYLEKNISLTECWIYGLLQFAFCLDIVFAIIIYCKAKYERSKKQ